MSDRPDTPKGDHKFATGAHHAHLMTTGRHGSWCSCPCGWSSGTYGTVIGAHLAFGRHLVTAEHLVRVNPAPSPGHHTDDRAED